VDTPAGIDRPRWRTTLAYRFAPTLSAGLEINAAVGEVSPIANWYALTENDRRPAIIFGTSSDRIGSPEGKRMYYFTFAKQIGHTPVAPYVSINYSETDRRINYPFGATFLIGREWTFLPMYDGQRAHTTLTWSGRRGESVTLLYVWNQRFGISFGLNF
jgi:hypothetical protein